MQCGTFGAKIIQFDRVGWYNEHDVEVMCDRAKCTRSHLIRGKVKIRAIQ